jgi:hypothetical protein
MEFPRFVYKSPGPSRHSSGGAYRFAVVNDQAEIDAHVAQGWSLTVREAIAKVGEPAFMYGLSPVRQQRLKAVKPWLKMQPAPMAVVEPAPEPAPVADDNPPPTRAEMMQQAELLGLKVDRRWSDETLLAKINAAMAAPAPAAPPAANDDPI